MSLRTSLKNLIRRDTAASLRERATELRGSLSRRTVVAGTVAAAVPLPALASTTQPERAEYRARLLTAYAEDRASKPIGSVAEFGTVEEIAADLVQRRPFEVGREIMALSPPKTLDGLILSALAAAVLCEADHTPHDPTKVAAIGLTRAVLAFTGTPLPPGFVGFGDEPDHAARDEALHASPGGTLPAWAVAAAQARTGRP
ncbi:hypothetical protein MKK65_26390 [Methylobacterium sp. J-001]|uniref:hypothetical protein n=1 Tax=Methylobacterium sp. J-001 TaxID=2836609 RepID=UPI001FBB04E2|nr:hypothetical protein [Methylobacterium sp. J-001]MCJ2120059.1 hypothetical protein [Methylobacterium sp. J-001]